jgi:hypothetical protein
VHPSPDLLQRVEQGRTKGAKLTDGMSAARRGGIAYIFSHLFGSPSPTDVDEEGRSVWNIAADMISKNLCMPAGSYAIIKKVFRDVLQAEDAGFQYNLAGDSSKRGRKMTIIDLTKEARLVYNGMRAGMGLTETTVLVNEFRKLNDLLPLSYSAVQRFAKASKVMEQHKRQTKKSGSKDPTSEWAKARVVQAKQWKQQLAFGREEDLERSKLKARDRSSYRPTFALPALHLNGISWWDEHHRKVRLGHHSKHETLLRYNKAGELATEEEGGVLEDEHPNTSAKFLDEARACFGTAVVPQRRGGDVGLRLEPFDYTGSTVLGPKKFSVKIGDEKRRVRNLTNSWDYDVKYPKVEDRDRELRRKLRVLGFVDVREVMEHVVAEHKRVYKGTVREKTSLIFHDGLSQWWEPDAQKHMKMLGFEKRQLHIDPSNDSSVAKHYQGKLVGDSPEFCRTLDAHGFSDLDKATSLNVAIASTLPVTDPLRKSWGMGTPTAMRDSMFKTWTQHPSSERIVEDAFDLELVLDRVIEAEGTVVPEEFLRKGRRRHKRGPGDGTKLKPRKRQRKDTLVATEHHPTLDDAYCKMFKN